MDLARSAARHGIGCFETILLSGGQPRFLSRHLARLATGLAELGMPGLPATEAITEAVDGRVGEGVVRLVAVDDELLVTTGPPRAHDGAPAAVGLSTRVRRLAGAATTRFKCLSYAENALAAREAVERGLFDVITLNERGLLADGGRSNLVLVLDGEAVTPPHADGALPGIVRGVLLEAGLVRETSLTTHDLARADAAAVTNALVGVRPLASLEGRVLDAAHPVLDRLRLALASFPRT